MGGYFGAANTTSCTFDLFFGTDYHSHLGTRRAGMAVYDGEGGFKSAVHNIENSPFRTKFEKDLAELEGKYGIGCISDYEAQPILMKSHHGTFAITTVSKINNVDEIVNDILKTNVHFFVMGNGEVNSTELVGALINQKDNLLEGIEYARKVIDGSVSMMILTDRGIYVARDKLGRTPIIVGKKEDGYCAAFESFSFLNLGYEQVKELGAGEIGFFDEHKYVTLVKPGDKMRICTFLWIYYGFTAASYEGVNVEEMRYRCGKSIAKDDNVEVDLVAGIPDSGVAHAIGYSTQSGVPYSRAFVKYTPTWPRSFMPTIQTKRDLIAHMKLLPIQGLIKDKRMLLIDDSIVRGTQLRETAQFLFEHGAKEVHVRPACPPLLYGCKYLNFSRSKSEMELITRRVIEELENGKVTEETYKEYANPDSEKYAKMVDAICEKLGFTSLRFHRLDDMLDSVDIDHDLLCTYCWDGRE